MRLKEITVQVQVFNKSMECKILIGWTLYGHLDSDQQSRATANKNEIKKLSVYRVYFKELHYNTIIENKYCTTKITKQKILQRRK